MAKENSTILLGVVSGFVFDEAGAPDSQQQGGGQAAPPHCKFLINIVRHQQSNTRYVQYGATHANRPLVYTEDERIMAAIKSSGMGNGDMVYVFGALASMRHDVTTYCPACHKPTVRLDRRDLYVAPLAVLVVRYKLGPRDARHTSAAVAIAKSQTGLKLASSGLGAAGLVPANDRYGVLKDLEAASAGMAAAIAELRADTERPTVERNGQRINVTSTDDEMSYLLRGLREMSNRVIIDGTCPRDLKESPDPKLGDFQPETPEHAAKLRFQIISDRIWRRDPDTTSDMIDVVDYGPRAVEAFRAIRHNSQMTINASIETRQYSDRLICGCCGNVYDKILNATYLRPYHYEWREGCVLPESTHVPGAAALDDG